MPESGAVCAEVVTFCVRCSMAKLFLPAACVSKVGAVSHSTWYVSTTSPPASAVSSYSTCSSVSETTDSFTLDGLPGICLGATAYGVLLWYGPYPRSLAADTRA